MKTWRTSPRSAGALRRAGGFTLIELLVLAGMLAVLVAILLPAVAEAMRRGRRLRIEADLNAVGVALAAYAQDFGSIPCGPATPPDHRGDAGLLARLVLAPGPADGVGADGFDGPGFRVGSRTQGQRYGPYLGADALKPRIRIDPSAAAPQDTYVPQLVDSSGRPVLFAPRQNRRALSSSLLGPSNFGSPAATGSAFDIGPAARFLDEGLNLVPTSTSALEFLRFHMGDSNEDNAIGPGETLLVNQDFVLWSAGADQVYGTGDDVMNFRR